MFASMVGTAAFSVSTHSRPKAAGQMEVKKKSKTGVSTHSRPKAAGYVDFEKSQI